MKTKVLSPEKIEQLKEIKRQLIELQRKNNEDLVMLRSILANE